MLTYYCTRLWQCYTWFCIRRRCATACCSTSSASHLLQAQTIGIKYMVHVPYRAGTFKASNQLPCAPTPQPHVPLHLPSG